MNKHLKVAVIGLDGANKTTAQLVGLNTKRIHEFISTVPSYTPPAWTSIFTGVNPAKHGVIGWQKFSIDTLKTTLFTSHDVNYMRISELLDIAGLKSIVVNLPLTYPFSGITNKDNTIIVSDWAAPEQTIYPLTLSHRYEEYLINPPHNWAKYTDNKKEYASLVKDYTKTRLNLYYELLERHDWNLFFIVFSEIDWFSHIYPQILQGKDTHLVTPTFKLISKFIENVQEIADITFIISDHGFERKHTIFHVNSALARGGFIKYSETKLKLARLVTKIVPKGLIEKSIKFTASPSNILEATVNLKRTNAFMSPEPTTWSIYCRNATITKKVKEYLNTFKEIEKVIEPKEIYTGPHIDKLPSLFIIPAKGVEYSSNFSNKITETKYMADHDLHGIFLVTGEGISEKISFRKSPKVYDIAPTLLYIFGLPIPRDMDGRVLTEIFEKDSELTKRRPVYTNLSYYLRKLETKKLERAIKRTRVNFSK